MAGMKQSIKSLIRNSALFLIFAIGASSCKEKSQFTHIVSDNNIYCGLTAKHEAQCWRYIVPRDQDQGNRRLPKTKEPFIFDALGLPKNIQKHQFTSLKMASPLPSRLSSTD